MQLTVTKADGSSQRYLHTKVIATFVNALCGDSEQSVVEELSDVVTYYLYNQLSSRTVSSSHILSVIQAVLCSTGYEYAAANIASHHHGRNLKRARIEIVKISRTKKAKNLTAENYSSLWNKSIIVKDLIAEYNIDAVTAAVIASMVEEKILDSGLYRLTAEFVKFLVSEQTSAVLRAQGQLDSEISGVKLPAQPVTIRSGMGVSGSGRKDFAASQSGGPDRIKLTGSGVR